MASSTTMYLIGIFTSSFIISCHAQSAINCTDQTQCQRQDIIADYIDCQSKRSCRGSTLTSNAIQGVIECSAEISCQFADSITSPNEVYCSGSRACFDSGPNIYCTGAGGCSIFNRRVENGVLYPNEDLYCYGSSACARRIIELGEKGICAGTTACIDATINGGTCLKYIHLIYIIYTI